ncbi:nuclear transport factor 2 family protein [Chryseobacterium sp.]|uniref:nuclear transport factor 2 family protein n=1 Tax=Chryseobacterium sp. TaxID=1871047 RepID=UPI002896EA0D|nr:nuclear transport factor 2 family protein [Chryseobacterium sp.]
MKKLFALTLIISSFSLAQQNSNTEIEKPIRDLFLAMKNADAVLIKSVFTETAVLETITDEGVKPQNISSFIGQVSKTQKNDLDERISIEAIHSDGNLASVFTPYSFYFKGKLSHCGANSFQLVKQNGEWKIQYLIDTRRKDNCKEIK